MLYIDENASRHDSPFARFCGQKSRKTSGLRNVQSCYIGFSGCSPPLCGELEVIATLGSQLLAEKGADCESLCVLFVPGLLVSDQIARILRLSSLVIQVHVKRRWTGEWDAPELRTQS
jgi:hypothetical protein